MKKLLLLLAILSSGVYASSIDHIQTYSPDYLSNQAQTGMIDLYHLSITLLELQGLKKENIFM